MKWINFVALLLLIYGCQKNSTTSFTVKGQINDSESGIPLGDVAIAIYENNSNNMNSASELIAQGVSNSDGSYSIEFPRNLVESYTILYTKEGYFTEEVTKSFEFFKTDQENIINLNDRPIGWIRFIIENTAPTDPQDQLKLYKETGAEYCPDCCADGYYYFDGPSVNTTMICPNVAGRYFVFRYWDVLAPSYAHDSVLIQQNDTIDYLIQY